MLENLRLHIGTSYARFHFRAARDPIVRFTEAFSEARRPVIFLPEVSAEASAVENVLKFLGQRFHTSKVVLVVRKRVVPYLPDLRGFDVVTFTEEELSAWYVPHTDLLRKMKKSTFDVALDLNIRFALPSSFLCRASQAPLRIGFVKQYADNFYNFQVQTEPSNNFTQVYSQLLKCIEMF
jgi:ADP-heptose:LPS heptosyltransferase